MGSNFDGSGRHASGAPAAPIDGGSQRPAAGTAVAANHYRERQPGEDDGDDLMTPGDEAILRAQHYRRAGADGFLYPG
jgi:hypothetical protein